MQKKIILFCIPYAGGSDIGFYKWKGLLDPQIELCPIELKGRGKRYDEGFYKDVSEAIDDIYDQIKDKIKDNKYAVYGHSMGSMLAYELYNRINVEGNKLPIHMFFSGRQAPSAKRKEGNIHMLPNEQFISRIIELGGTPKEVTESKELMDFILPILRNDFKLVEAYKLEVMSKIKCNISVLNGDKDDIDEEGILAWKNHAADQCKIYTFNGGHFFINDKLEEVIEIINATLK
ncbi:thioesterase II family protein [Clostridium cellulovorans]|uniref:Oleoyl-(Acyl-carrier-protein) hydrolase n=1 Tax=Clostridium cellulovorans (strain ATCC 35296 / DSM 3052 / OCM 3 / 743B) TaxID=573061 RepID=D9SKJ1_CLOC7|nr:thioesterase domain-containing protein [Clostridium cellulovorans]ADL51487.1 Oleoyl-(acyl-carrier-protein) hydrolase [Clostridium cellulovorans 743B]